MLERYFKRVLIEKQAFTRIGSWWDRKGENEIDIVAENELEETATFFEVKRKAENIDLEVLETKAAVFLRATGEFKGVCPLIQGAVHGRHVTMPGCSVRTYENTEAGESEENPHFPCFARYSFIASFTMSLNDMFFSIARYFMSCVNALVNDEITMYCRLLFLLNRYRLLLLRRFLRG